MPELPEVETTRSGIEPYLLDQKVKRVILREPRLRWPVDLALPNEMKGASILKLQRRGKYILVETTKGVAIWHLGMSGTLRVVDAKEPPQKHDHVDWVLSDGIALRYRDPRRFGSLHWTNENPLEHPLLVDLGVEPLSDDFNGDYLYQKSRGRRVAIKQFVMNSQIVVGVGNIYANESLFKAGIHPKRGSGRVSLARYEQLVQDIKEILAIAINKGGTTLRDFVGSDGNPGYFQQRLKVYGRGGEPCCQCGMELIEEQIGQRATVFCKLCQT